MSKENKPDFEWPEDGGPANSEIGEMGLPRPPARRSRRTDLDASAEEGVPPMEREVSSDEARGRLMADVQRAGLVTTTISPASSEFDDTVRGYTTRLPVRVKRAVEGRGLEESRPMNYYILKGLQMQGFPVSDDDLIDRRGSYLKNLAGRL